MRCVSFVAIGAPVWDQATFSPYETFGDILILRSTRVPGIPLSNRPSPATIITYADIGYASNRSHLSTSSLRTSSSAGRVARHGDDDVLRRPVIRRSRGGEGCSACGPSRFGRAGSTDCCAGSQSGTSRDSLFERLSTSCAIDVCGTIGAVGQLAGSGADRV